MLQEQLDQLQFDKEESEVKYEEMKVRYCCTYCEVLMPCIMSRLSMSIFGTSTKNTDQSLRSFKQSTRVCKQSINWYISLKLCLFW